jgi:secreted trypsin-like serine protease
MRRTTRGCRRVITGVIGVSLSLGFLPLGVATASVGHMAPQVVGGAPINSSAVPWQVLFIIGNSPDKSTLCSGSLISATTVVSAAHCFTGISPGAVQGWTGVTNIPDRNKGSKLAISAVTVHPGYDTVTNANDIAIIQLSAPADIAGAARVISLPLTQDPSSWPQSGTAAGISGWGAVKNDGLSSDALRGATVQVLGSPTDTCGQYGSTFAAANSICAGVPGGGIDTCQGDSGGPLVVVVNGLPVLAGLTSTGGECASAQLPGVYTRLTTYLPWVRSMTELPVAAPGAPTGIAVSSAAGKTNVSWVAPADVGGASTVWTVTATPSGQTCRTSGTQCAVPGLKLGSEASFTVQGSNPVGTGVASTPTAPATIVSGVAAPGARIAATTIAKWSGLKGSGLVKAGTGSGGTCKMSGSAIVMMKAGLCTVTVSRGKSKAQAVVLIK